MTILIIAEHDQQQLKAATRSAITAAQAFNEEVDLLVAGQGVDAVARAAAAVQGVARVLVADGPAYAHGLAENLAPLVARLAADYSTVLAAATSSGKELLPRVAALLDVAMVSEVTRIVDASTFVRPIYAGNLNATVQSAERIKVLTVRATSFEAATDGGNATIEPLPAMADAGLSTWISTTIQPLDRPELATARVVVSGGRALGSAEQFQQLLAPLAARLNAALGATRAAVDAGYAPNDWQVGQTGTVVAPQLYIAVGISGAVQHIAGMKESRVIVAINHDPEAPIFQWADYALVADLFTAVKELEQGLQ
jgi:electron transfer flavoprotein alpha subunit